MYIHPQKHSAFFDLSYLYHAQSNEWMKEILETILEVLHVVGI